MEKSNGSKGEGVLGQEKNYYHIIMIRVGLSYMMISEQRCIGAKGMNHADWV